MNYPGKWAWLMGRVIRMLELHHLFPLPGRKWIKLSKLRVRSRQ